MKGSTGSETLFKTSLIIKISAFALISFAFFYLGKRFSSSDGYQQLVFFNSRQDQSPLSVSESPNINKTLDLAYLSFNQTVNATNSAKPPPPQVLERLGIIDENGSMSDEFEVGGELDPSVVEDWGNGTEVEKREESVKSRVKIEKFKLCPESMREYIPCLDNVEEIQKLKSTEKGEKYERHCPGEGKGFNCLVPAPKDYKTPITWPRSRDEILSDRKN